MWIARVSISDIPGSFNAAVRNKFPLIVDGGQKNIRNIILKWLNDVAGVNPISDAGILKKNLADINSFETMTQLEIIHNWIKQLGTTYYGKQFLSPLNQKICYYQPYDDPFAERVFSDVPTKEGAWVDDGVPVLGLSDPELSTFREEDNRIGCFALFNDSGENDSVDPPTGANSTIGS
jgi:hypothetical protein